MNLRELMSETKFYSDYSRYNEKTKKYESWDEAVERVMEMHTNKYSKELSDSTYLTELFEEVKQGYKDKIFIGAQRALQFGGKQIAKNDAKLYNCSSSYVDRVDFFSEFMWLLLSGAGCGASVQKHHIAKLPKLIKPSGQLKTFVIPDSIEGWSDAKGILMASFFEPSGQKFDEWSGKRVHFEYDKIRQRGSYISGGFKAPGPDPLRNALQLIETKLKNIVDEREGGKIKPIEAYDICMYSADAVISGGVRRSATIFLFSADDEEMATAKTGSYWLDNPQRGRSNNSAVIVRNMITENSFMDTIQHTKEYGEPGFVFVDDKDTLYNPCVEVGMFGYLDPETRSNSGWQVCNLSEIPGENCKTAEEFYRACRLASAIGTMQAGYTDFHYLTDTSREIIRREALIGVSITGWMNNPKILFDAEILKEGARIVKETNKKVAKLLGINQAARTTVTKPSGNASVILQTSSGFSCEHSRNFLRYNTYPRDSDMAKLIKDTNPHMVEDGTGQQFSYSIAFPVEVSKDAIVREDMSGVEFLKKVKFAYENWIEEGTNKELCVIPSVRHNISNTVNVGENEWDEVGKYIFENRECFSGISLMPGSGDRAFFQAPFTEVKLQDEIIEEHGVGAMFASGLIVDATIGYDHLWQAIYISSNMKEEELTGEKGDLQKRWYRRFRKFADQYFEGDYERAGTCLKDVHILYRWEKIGRNYVPIDLQNNLGEKDYVDVDTLAAQACGGGACEISF